MYVPYLHKIGKNTKIDTVYKNEIIRNSLQFEKSLKLITHDSMIQYTVFSLFSPPSPLAQISPLSNKPPLLGEDIY